MNTLRSRSWFFNEVIEILFVDLAFVQQDETSFAFRCVLSNQFLRVAFLLEQVTEFTDGSRGRGVGN